MQIQLEVVCRKLVREYPIDQHLKKGGKGMGWTGYLGRWGERISPLGLFSIGLNQHSLQFST
jgi:hypothetical protein